MSWPGSLTREWKDEANTLTLARSQLHGSKKMIQRYVLIAAAVLALSGCAMLDQEQQHQRPAEPRTSCVPNLTLKDGWLGGDGVSSVPLHDGRVLWLFGDTFIGTPGAKNRKGAAMIDNSVAVSACDGEGAALAYIWRQDGGKPAPFFKSKRAGEKYWPLSAVRGADGATLVFLSRVKTLDTGSPLGFEIVGTDIARLSSAEPSPNDWPLTIEPLYDGKDWIVGAGAARDGADTLLLAAAQPPAQTGHQMAVLRLTGEASAWSLEAKDARDVWQKFPQNRPAHVIAAGSSEASLVHTTKGWRIVHAQGGLAQPHIMIRSADDPEGDWSGPKEIFEYPEMTIASPRWRKGVFCYAAKAHPEFSKEGKLFVTYACNTTQQDQLIDDTTIYRPRVEWLSAP